MLVYGDTNSLYTNAKDNIRRLSTRAGLTDAWVQLRKGGRVPAIGSKVQRECGNPAERNQTCEIIDKVFYKSSPSVRLTATEFRYATPEFLSANRSILSDHNPVAVRFKWSVVS